MLNAEAGTSKTGKVHHYLDDKEIVHVVFRNDHEKLVNVAMDSYSHAPFRVYSNSRILLPQVFVRK